MANAPLDPTVKQALIDWIKKRLGLWGALKFKRAVEHCTCDPCQTIREVLSGTADPAVADPPADPPTQ